MKCQADPISHFMIEGLPDFTSNLISWRALTADVDSLTLRKLADVTLLYLSSTGGHHTIKISQVQCQEVAK